MRERFCLDRNWRFSLGHAADASKDFAFARDRSLVKSGEARGAAGTKFDDSKWELLNIPHDWAIDLPLTPKKQEDREVVEHAFRAIGPEHPETSIGWYRKRFKIPKEDLGRRITIEFDGVFRDSVVWINGHRLARYASGHTAFYFDITDLLVYGGENVLAVRCDATNWEGWWYEGAGIYRHVWLTKTDTVHVATWGTHVIATLKNDKAMVDAVVTVMNEQDSPATIDVLSNVDAVEVRTRVKLAPWETREVRQKLTMHKPGLWSPETPTLYTLRTHLIVDGKTRDPYDTSFGVRSFRWDSQKGFFLNGQPYKIKGTCNQQNFAGVGTAMPDRMHEWRVEKLKELGSNAYRCSHYMATPALLDACDRLGLLVLAENRLADVGPQFLDDWKTQIRRDRNRACIFLWSVGNEEHTIQWAIAGERIGKTLVRVAHELDPTRMVTCAMHDRGLGEGFANVMDVHGWNYINVGDISAFHARRPEQPIINTEEGSTVCTRGEYVDDKAKGYVSSYDLRSPKWGSRAQQWWPFVASTEWVAGSFVWTGFDYRGEPIPYKWPCTSSHFGLMDLCGFPKDLYWYFRSWWRPDETILHLFPHWNWAGKKGQPIDVRVFSNCDEVELFLNDQSQGRQPVPKNMYAQWQVNYAPGRLVAHGYRSVKRIASTQVETTGKATQLVLTTDRKQINADGEDVSLVAIRALDAQGRFAPLASNLITFELSGPGRIIGVGNGDPSSAEKDHANKRKLFNGLAMAIVQSTDRAGKIKLTARTKGFDPVSITLSSRRTESEKRYL